MSGGYLVPTGKFSIAGMKVQIVEQERFRKGNLCGMMLALMMRVLPPFLRKKPDRYLGHHSYFKPNGFAAKYASSGRTFSFEEGLGTYGTLAHHVRVAKREGMKFPFLKFCIKKALGSRIFVDRRWTPMLFESDGDLLPLKTVFSAFPKAFEYTIESDIEGAGAERVMLFFTAPLVELGILSRNEYANLLHSISDTLAQVGVRVLFKPHPLERDWNDEFPCVRTQAPSEVAIPMLNPECVGGFSTGALITAKLIFKLKAFSFNSFLPWEAAEQLRIEGPVARLFSRHVIEFQKSEFVKQVAE
ncbi:MAG: hypothetical protein CMM07_24525 [Rhodopirellula sp.]|nr:hypothetical protein [Rhodopirellula sp.]